MSVGGGAFRPQLSKKEDVLKLIQNLVFCWVGYHSHTYSAIPLATYWHFRPSIIKKSISPEEKDW